MEKTNLLTKIIALSLTVVCIASVASLAQFASAAAEKNRPELSTTVTTLDESTTDSPLPGNLCIRCDSLEEAMELTGINIKLPEYSDAQIFAYKGQYIEVQYAIDEYSTMTIRKSADETEYTNVDCDKIVKFETENDITVYGKWVDNHEELNHHGFVGAYFTTEDGTYSLSYDCLMSIMDLNTIIDDICLS